MAWVLKYGPIPEDFIQKHGQFYCSQCKKEGKRVLADAIPQGWPRSIRFKREFASCIMHLEEAHAAALAQIKADRDDYETEGEYQARTQFL